ncbi:MAG: enoyl-CoA hydratase/isomerase family protein [Desulfobacterales bacterium]|jgi:enoyl-CoA hydratase/carnithine racemase
MRKITGLEDTFDFFTGERIGSVLLLNFRENLMLRATDLTAKKKFLDYLDLASNNKSIKVIVIMSSPDKTGRAEYLNFFEQVKQSKLDPRSVLILFNSVDQCILKIRTINQMVIHANSGKVLSLFLNASLACDYRIIADNTVFQNPCLEIGMVPKGGGAFFLSKMLGVSKAYDVLLCEKDITADEALALGLVDRVVPFDELRESTLQVAQEFARKPRRSIAGAKKLLNYSIKDLEEYLDFETRELGNIIGPNADGLVAEAD